MASLPHPRTGYASTRPARPGCPAGTVVPDTPTDGTHLARIDYDGATAASFRAAREIPRSGLAAREIRRVLRPGAPVLVRNAFAGRYERLRIVRWFPETARSLDTYPSVEETCEAFASAGFTRAALESVPQTDLSSLAELLERADTLMRGLTEEEFTRGKDRLREAVLAGRTPQGADLTSSLDLLVLR